MSLNKLIELSRESRLKAKAHQIRDKELEKLEVTLQNLKDKKQAEIIQERQVTENEQWGQFS